MAATVGKRNGIEALRTVIEIGLQQLDYDACNDFCEVFAPRLVAVQACYGE
ncbi:hypothetical protein PTKU64_86650 [Paraburkholderia terrae]|uniref:Uncharacterized protein n=1 Tax=Paraburkholderia terrae TaxID=311230 RepID=A0ABM7U1B2_9BURK|nr:hypothetical protein PTKU64_86650 [Paraburkholderia terrae]